MENLPVLIAPLAAIACGLVASWHFGRRTLEHRERTHDLRETHKAMVAHFNAMDKVVADDVVPAVIKKSLMQVSSALADRHIAELICGEITQAKRRKRDEKSEFQRAVEKLKVTHPKSFANVETAMSSALLILMLRWPQTSRNFKEFVISAMINEQREVAIFDRAYEIALRDRGPATSKSPAFNLGAAVA